MELSVGGRKAYAYNAGRAPDAARPSVVFVHGAGLDHSFWGLQSRYFAYHGRNVLSVDLPGRGRSEGPPLPTIEAMADWVIALLDAARLQRASVIGKSMGSLVALECAARYPQRVERIALVGTAFPMRVSKAFLDAARDNEPAAHEMHTIWGHAATAPLSGNPFPGMWLYGDTLARLARLAPGVLFNDLRACNDYAAGLQSAAKLKCPALFILGARDMMTPPKAAQQLIAAVPNAKAITIKPSGHSLMAEAPDATLDALIAFLA